VLAFSSALARAMNLARAMEVVPDSVTSGEVVAPDSVMKLAHAMEMAPQDLEDSMTPQELELDSSAQQDFVADSLPPGSQSHPCVRCGVTHDYNDVEGCRRLATSLAGAPVESEPSKMAMQNACQMPKREQERPKKCTELVCAMQNSGRLEKSHEPERARTVRTSCLRPRRTHRSNYQRLLFE